MQWGDDVKKYGGIVLGNLMVAFAINVLILDYGLVFGGVSGLGAVLHHYLKLPVSVMVAIINVFLFTLAYVSKGREFAGKTLISAVLLPLFLEGFNQMRGLHGLIQDPLLIALMGGLLIGVGTGMIINAKASGGGFDIVGIILNDHFHVNISVVTCVIDLLIILLQLPYHEAASVGYGLLCIMVVGISMNIVIRGVNRGIQVLVFSKKQHEIEKALIEKLDVGLTLLHGQGGYSKDEMDVILSIITVEKLPQFKHIVHTIDDQAFLITSSVSEVSGQGFTINVRH